MKLPSVPFVTVRSASSNAAISESRYYAGLARAIFGRVTEIEPGKQSIFNDASVEHVNTALRQIGHSKYNDDVATFDLCTSHIRLFSTWNMPSSCIFKLIHFDRLGTV